MITITTMISIFIGIVMIGTCIACCLISSGMISKKLDQIGKNDKSDGLQAALTKEIAEVRGSVTNSINERFIEVLKQDADSQEKLRNTLSENLDKIQSLTEKKLSDIQADMSEKLDTSLNKRIDESFEKVSTQLSQLYKSLGELSEMSDGISSLNRTLSNVKTRGTWGEVQLGALLEDVLDASQYESNVKIKASSDDLVEYAVKMPSREEEGTYVYLPIDSKFPMDRYEEIIRASEAGDAELSAKAVKDLEQRIKLEARTIRDKYVTPPKTTDFAIMFLPTESLYAEVIRIPGLMAFCQNQTRVLIAGPTTLAALLNSLKVGFRNVALSKKTAEIRKMLEAIKTQYGKLDELIEGSKRKLEAAMSANEELQKRTGIIIRKMNKIGELEMAESDELLGINGSEGEEE